MQEQVTLRIMDAGLEEAVRTIRREDVSEAFVDSIEYIIDTTHYGAEHGYLGHTFAIFSDQRCVGVLLLGEAIPWATDPPEMQREPFYRLMGFVIDKAYRGQGIGGYALEAAIDCVCRDFGRRPIALGVHQDNHGAARFYQRHGFTKTEYMEGSDYYYLRFPPNKN